MLRGQVELQLSVGNVPAVRWVKNHAFTLFLTTMYMNVPAPFRAMCRLKGNPNCFCR